MCKKRFPTRSFAADVEISNFKSQIFCVATLFFFVGFTSSASASRSGGSGISNPTTPVSARPSLSPTIPVSSFNSGGFLRAPSSSASSNQVITGNVPGLSYFHGAVPYTSQGSFMGNLPSTSVDFFRRYTAPEGRPFYSPTASSPGLLSAQSAPSEKIRLDTSAGRISYPSIAMQPLSAVTPPSRYSLFSYNKYQDDLMSGISGYKIPEKFFALSDRGRLTPQEKPKPPVLTPVEQIQQSLLEINKNLDSSERTDKIQPQLKPFTSDRLKDQLEQLNKLLEQETTMENANKKIEETVKKYWNDKIKAADADSKSLLEKFKKLSAANAAASGTLPSDSVLKPDKSKILPISPQVEKEWEKQADEQMLIGYQLLKEQNFYPAADAFTRAALYKPSDPNGYAGKALALFAAGDYMFASQLLAIALEFSPDYAKTNLNIADMLGLKTKLDERIADLQKFASQNNSGRLYFLLAFVQYKTGQLTQAKASIEQAIKLMPDEPSVKSLKSAIDSPPEK